jgi:hypothetical protein
MPTPPPLLNQPGCGIWAIEAAMLIEWRGEFTTLEDVRRLHQLSAQLAEKYPKGIAQLSVVRDGGGSGPARVGQDVRSELMNLLRDESLRFRAGAVVLPGGGLRMSMVRSLLTGLALFARTSTPIRLFATVAEGEAWIHATCRNQQLSLPPLGSLNKLAAEVALEMAPGQPSAS